MDKKTGRRTRPRDPEKTRRRLLDAARQLFVRHGFAGASLDAITQLAGVNKALVRYHFGGKRGLYNQVFLEGLTAAQERLDELAAASGPATERLEHLVEAFAGFYAARPDLVMLLTREQMEGATRLEAEVIAALLRFSETTRKLLGDGIAAGRLRQLDAHHVHLALAGSLIFFQLTAPARESYARRGALPGSALAWSDHVAVVRTILLHGLAAQPSGPETPSPPTARR